MKRLILLFLLLPSIAFAAAPTRTSVYTTGTTISSSAVTGNEDALFTYVQNGVEVYADDTIVNADIKSSAAIEGSKLDLSVPGVIGGTTPAAGSFTTLTISGTSTFAGQTITDLGSVTTADTNGGTIGGVTLDGTIGVDIGSDATGDVYYRNASGDLARLAKGTSGHFLQIGASIPTWAASGSVSNVLFAWSGIESATTNSHGEYIGTSLTPSIAAETMERRFLAVEGTTYRTLLLFQFTKIAGIDTVTIHARMWAEAAGGGQETIMNVDIGSQSNTVTTVTSTTPAWVTTATIDVSGLSDGTTYDGIIQLKSEDASGSGYCSAVVLVGS